MGNESDNQTGAMPPQPPQAVAEQALNTNIETSAPNAPVEQSPSEPAPKRPNKLKTFFEKLGKSPVFVGSRKFITIPLIVLALAALIATPIIIISVNNSNQQSEEELDPVFVAWVEEYAASIEDALENDDGEIDSALEIVDERLKTETDPERRRVILGDKASLTDSAGRYDEAIAAMEEYISESDASGNYRAKETGLAYLAELYYEFGDKEKSLELFYEAYDMLGAYVGGDYQNAAYYAERIPEIEAELSGETQ